MIMRKYLVKVKYSVHANPNIWYKDKIGAIYIANLTKEQRMHYHSIDGIRFIHEGDAEIISSAWSEDVNNIIYDEKPKKMLLACGHLRLTEGLSKCYFCDKEVNEKILRKIINKKDNYKNKSLNEIMYINEYKS